jgi:capsular polysaccharide biosynthesis protein
MELRTYGHILARRWWLALIPAIVVLGLGLATYHRPAPVYQVGLRFTVGYTPESSSTYLYDRYYPAWLASEYIAGGLGDWVKTGDFASEVSHELEHQGLTIPTGALIGHFASDNKRSVVTMFITWSDSRQLEAIATASINVLQSRYSQAFPQLGPNTTVRVVDPVNVGQVPLGLRAQLDLPVRVVLALAVGIALVFLTHYLWPERSA